MIIKLATSVRNAMAQAILDALDVGSGPAVLEFYDGAMPANLGAVTTQVLLGAVTFSDPSGTISGGVLTFGTVTQDSAADASGTASWVRIKASTGTVVIDGDVTNTGGTGFVKMNTTAIVAGGPIQVSSGALTMPGG